LIYTNETMSSISIMLLMVGSSVIFLALVALIVFIVVRRRDRGTSTTPDTSPVDEDPIELVDDGMFTISRNESYIGQDFDESRGKGKMCDASVTKRANAAPFKFTKDGSSWIIATDCDGDGNYTSFLNGTEDLIAARNKKKSSIQRWNVECLSKGCSFKNKDTGKYLAGTFKNPEYTKNPVFFNVTPF